MADFSDAFDPYTPPAEVQVPKPSGSLPGGALPGGLKAICIIAIILGSLGTMAALVSGVGLVAGQMAQAALNPQQSGASPEMEQIQQAMQAEINAITSRYIVPQTAAVIMHLFTAVLLLVGSIMTLLRKGRGPGILTFGCAASILYVVGEGILNVLIQLQTIPVIESFMDSLMAEAGKQAGQGADAMAGVSKFAVIFVFIVMAFFALLALVKIVFYLISIFYFRKPQVRALFRSEKTGFQTM